MKRLLITLAAVMLVTATLLAKDDEVIVTRQLTMSQRNSLPEKTISVEMKRLSFNKKAAPGLVEAINQVMDTIAREDYQNRTFVLMLEPKSDGTIGIAAHSDDIITHGRQDQGIYLGALEHQRYHFVLLIGKDNVPLLEQTFKRQGKVTFVQEFEFVEFPATRYPTNVIAQWSQQAGFKWLTVIINDDMNIDRDSRDHAVTIKD